MGCAGSRPAAADAAAPPRRVAGDDDDATLSAETHFSLAEVHALRGLYARHANELHQDGLLHRDELAWALFRAHRDSLFVDRIFSLFDIKQNAVIEYGEFVRSLSVFHPAAPLEEKAAFAFRVYDLDASGAIEPPELRRFLAALAADNPDVDLDAQALDEIVDSAFAELALARPGRISPEEWAALAARSPEVISFMTLPKLAALATGAEGGGGGARKGR